jgi:hypothetical protein
MKNILLILLLFLVGCSEVPQNTKIPRTLNNACVPQAMAMVKGLEAHGIEAEVILMVPKTPGMGHALAVYRFKKKIWAWDASMGTVELRALWEPNDMGSYWWVVWGKNYPAFRDKEFGGAWFLEGPEEFGIKK